MKAEMKRMKEDSDQAIKNLVKDVRKLEKDKVDRSECVSTNGGMMNTDIDMQKYRLTNLRLPEEDNEPITKAVYDDIIGQIDSLRVFVQLKHP